MPKDSRDLLEVLKSELNFLEKGGYARPLRARWRAQLIFEDSPTCMNYDICEERQPCSECVLLKLVPPEARNEKFPCRHIALNAAGETVDSLYRTGTQEELEGALRNWLRETVRRAEQQREYDRNSMAIVKWPDPVCWKDR